VNAIAFMTANYVARETGYAMHGWGHGDRVTNERFSPLETYRERLDEILADARDLGFDTVDLWGAHLNPAWAADEHVEAALELLAAHDLRVATYAVWVGPSELERACDIALALGTDLIGAGFTGDAATVAAIARDRGVRLAYENHPERTPQEALERIAGGEGALGLTVDTGWWATHGYDPVQAIEELGDRVWHVHLKDVLREGEPHDTCRWGEGVVPVEECVRALQRIGYTGAITVEHEPEREDPSEDCRAMRAQLEEWLR
jgi:L-ribulose-5-phosphate 3-epimerase